MTRAARLGRRAASAALSAALVLASFGLEPSSALAQVVQARVQSGPGVAGVPAVPLSASRPVLGLPSPSASAGFLSPSLTPFSPAPALRAVPDVPVPSEALRSVAGFVEVSPAYAVSGAIGLPAPEKDGAAALAASVSALATDLKPHLEASQKLDEAGAESASGVGTKLEAALLGLKSVERGEQGLAPDARLLESGRLAAPRAGASLSAVDQPGADAPLSPSLSAPAPQAKRGLAARVWSWLSGWYRVLPDKERNRQFWRFLATQCLVAIGFSFHNTAMPNLAAPSAASAANLGYARAAGWAAQAAANAGTGPLVDRQPLRRIISVTHLLRAAALFAVPILFFHGWLSFGALMTVLFAAGFLESVSYSAEEVAQMRIMGADDKLYNKVNAVAAVLHHVVGVLAPLLAGAFIGWVDMRLGALAGSALSYAVYGVLAAAGAVLFHWWLRLPREGATASGGRLREMLEGSTEKFPGVKAVYPAAGESGTVLVVEASDPAKLSLPAEFEGYAVKVVAAKGVREGLKEFARGFRLMWADRFLRKVCLLFPALYLFVADSVLYTALPRLIQDVLDCSAGAAFLGRIPFVGPMIAALSNKAGAFGLFLAAQSLGLGLSTLWMALRQKRAARVAAAKPAGRLSPLEKDGVWTSILHGVGALAYWGIFFSGGLWGAVGAMLLASFLKGPASIAWFSVEQKAIRERHPEDAGKIFSAMFFYSLVLSVAGVLAFGLLMEILPISAILWVVGGAMTATAILDFIEPYSVFPVSNAKRPSR